MKRTSISINGSVSINGKRIDTTNLSFSGTSLDDIMKNMASFASNIHSNQTNNTNQQNQRPAQQPHKPKPTSTQRSTPNKTHIIRVHSKQNEQKPKKENTTKQQTQNKQKTVKTPESSMRNI